MRAAVYGTPIRRWVSLLVLFLLAAAQALAQEAPAGTGPPHRFRDFHPERAIDFLVDQLHKAGADEEHQGIHLIVGFSTGHYSLDPVHAEAMAKVASALYDRFLVPGDRVSTVAWEMDVWRDYWNQPFDPRRLAALKAQWPTTPCEGSQGGHDYNRALLWVLKRLMERSPAARDYAILMLCPHPYSQTPPGVSRDPRMVADDNPTLVDLRLDMGAAPWVTYEIPFTDEATGRERRVCMALVVPRRFQPTQLLFKPRLQLLEHRISSLPTISGISPASVACGGELRATVSGTNLTGASVTCAGDGVAVRVLSGGTASALPVAITVSRDATPGPRTIRATSRDGTPGLGEAKLEVLPVESHYGWVLVLVLLALGIGALVAYTRRRPLARSGPELVVRVGSEKAELRERGPWRRGEVIRRLVGPATEEKQDRDVPIANADQHLVGPLLTFVGEGGGAIRATPAGGLTLKVDDTNAASSGAVLTPRAEAQRLFLTGTMKPDPDMPPVPVNLELEVEFK